MCLAWVGGKVYAGPSHLHMILTIVHTYQSQHEVRRPDGALVRMECTLLVKMDYFGT